MERNIAAARHSWARQHAGQLLSFFLFPVGHPMSAGCTYIPYLPGGQAVLLHVDLRDGGVQAPLLRPDRHRRLLRPKPDRAQH